jgi:hypothetical protein
MLPGEADRLANPQPGMGQELEEQPPLVGERREDKRQLGVRERLHLRRVLAVLLGL